MTNDYAMVDRLLATGEWRLLRQGELYKRGDIKCHNGKAGLVPFYKGSRCYTSYGPTLRRVFYPPKQRFEDEIRAMLKAECRRRKTGKNVVARHVTRLVYELVTDPMLK